MAYLKNSTKYHTLQSYCYHNIFMWNKDKIYVMDNHKDALWCWLQRCNENEKYNFMHIDRHYDLLDCYLATDLSQIKNNPKMSFDSYCTLRRSDGAKLMRWDNYINIGVDIFPNWFNSPIFVTHKVSDSKGWFSHNIEYIEEEPTYLNSIINQYINEPSEYLYGITSGCASKKWIVNLDLDVFFSDEDNHVRVFSDEFIRCISNKLHKAMDNIAVLTIAISPDCLFGKEMFQKWQSGIKVLNIMSKELPELEEIVADLKRNI